MPSDVLISGVNTVSRAYVNTQASLVSLRPRPIPSVCSIAEPGLSPLVMRQLPLAVYVSVYMSLLLLRRSAVSNSLPSRGISPANPCRWAAISSSNESSRHRDRTHVSCLGRWIPHHGATGEAHICQRYSFQFALPSPPGIFACNPCKRP